MKIRFLTLIRELRKAGDDVLVVTPDRNPPPSYHGAKVRLPSTSSGAPLQAPSGKRGAGLPNHVRTRTG